MKILLTNDDSHHSPLLEFVIKNLKKVSDLTIVIPKHEQSWKGKSMTRFSHLHLEKTQIFGEKVYTVDGTPADCVNIGIYHVMKDCKPDLIVSGINAGMNAGLGFIWSSGTLGACYEANIAGLPAIAFSQFFDNETSDAYIESYTISEPTLKKLESQCNIILDRLLKLFLFEHKELLNEPITWNINFPFDLNPNMQYIPCSSGQSFYGSCYKVSDLTPGIKIPDETVRFEHGLTGISMDRSSTCDNQLLIDGHVAVTPMDIRKFAQLSEAECKKLAKVLK